MPHSFDDLLRAYERQLVAPWRTDLSPAERVWILWYDPTLERRVRAQHHVLEDAAIRAGHGWRHADVAAEFGAWIAGHRFFGALLRKPDELSAIIPEFERDLVHRLRQFAVESSPSDILMLTGAASLFGISSVSRVIEAVSTDVRGRLVVSFPGQYEAGRYRLLSARDGWNYHAIPVPSTNL